MQLTNRARVLALGVAALVAVSVLSTTAVAQSNGGEKPTATDVGITDKEIHIAVIADVDSPLAPNLFKASRDAVVGIGKYLNSKEGGGGLAGRKVVVDFYDSKLNANEATNAMIKACENDVAMVGTAIALLTSVDNMRNCKDSTGAVTGIPDIPFFTNVLAHQCSDQSFPMQPPLIHCDTKDQHPQTFTSSVSRANYFQSKYGKGDLHGVYVFPSDTKGGRDNAFVSIGGLREVGITSDGDFDVSARAPQSAYTPVVQQIKASGSNYAAVPLYAMMTSLQKEAELQGVTSVKVWDCLVSCYDKQYLSQAGSAAEGTYVGIPFLPFYSKADRKANAALDAYAKYVGEENLGGYGAYAWAAGLAFRDAVNAAVKAHGINGVTRKTILESLDKMHKFDADGMYATIDLAGRKISKCGAIVQVKDGDFVRVRPTKPGTLICDPKGTLTRKLDIF